MPRKKEAGVIDIQANTAEVFRQFLDTAKRAGDLVAKGSRNEVPALITALNFAAQTMTSVDELEEYRNVLSAIARATSFEPPPAAPKRSGETIP